MTQRALWGELDEECMSKQPLMAKQRASAFFLAMIVVFVCTSIPKMHGEGKAA